MKDSLPQPDAEPSQFSLINTTASAVTHPVRLLERYSKAIYSYLRALLGKEDGGEAAGEFFADKVLERKFVDWKPGKGRFRKYLKVSVFNHAIDYQLRRKRLRGRETLLADPDSFPDLVKPGRKASEPYRDAYRAAILDGAKAALQAYQKQHRGNVYFTLVELLGDRETADSQELAAALKQATERDYTPASARQQKARALRKLAELLVEQVCQLDRLTTPEALDELRELGLEFVIDFLPEKEKGARALSRVPKK